MKKVNHDERKAVNKVGTTLAKIHKIKAKIAEGMFGDEELAALEKAYASLDPNSPIMLAVGGLKKAFILCCDIVNQLKMDSLKASEDFKAHETDADNSYEQLSTAINSAIGAKEARKLWTCAHIGQQFYSALSTAEKKSTESGIAATAQTVDM